MKIEIKQKNLYFILVIFSLLFLILSNQADAANGEDCKKQGGICDTNFLEAPGSYNSILYSCIPEYADLGKLDCEKVCCKPNQNGSNCEAAGGKCLTSGDSEYSVSIGTSDCENNIVVQKNCYTKPSVASTSSGTFSYEPMEEIPGFGRPKTFPEYILAVYKFGLWTVGIVAVLMISIGGYMYLTSAGNNASVEKAKTIITDAIIGFILAMVSWLLLFIINPDLVSLNPLIQGVKVTGSAGSPGSVGGPPGTTKGYKAACPDPNSTAPIDFSKAKNDSSIKLSSACDKYDFSNNYGVSTCLLKAVAQLESSCGAKMGPSSAHACGLMQLTEGTATKINRDFKIDPKKERVTCNDLKNGEEGDKLSIKLAAAFIKYGSDSSCAGLAKDKNSVIFAGYNSGYECTGIACSPKKHALCPSSDCSGALAFECCKNPVGLDESINYAWNGVGLLSQCGN